jgi:hypothetical protein
MNSKIIPPFLFLGALVFLGALAIWRHNSERQSEMPNIDLENAVEQILKSSSNSSGIFTTNIGFLTNDATYVSYPHASFTGQIEENIVNANSKTVMQIVLTSVFLVTSIIVILSKRFDTNSTKWAYGTIGTLIGFWFGTA